jgi:hypothetical protein
VLRALFAVALLSVAASSCGSDGPTSLPCQVNLAHIVADRELRLAANQTASAKVGPYTVRFVIIGTPIDGRGTIRIDWAGPDLTSGTVAGRFDARHVGSIAGQMKVRSGTLYYSCGALGRM